MSKTADIVGVLSGKGGVGKTMLVSNLALAAAARGSRVLAVDGDLGLSNLDLALGLVPDRTVADLLAGACSFEETIVEDPRGIHLLPAATARSDLPSMGPSELGRLLVPLFQARARYDLILVDLGSGISSTVLSLSAACDRLLLVATPDPTSLADAYAVVKVLCGLGLEGPIEVLINGVRGQSEAIAAHGRLRRVAQRFLQTRLPLAGYVSKDARVAEAIKLQQPVVEAFPSARASHQIRKLAEALLARSWSTAERPAIAAGPERTIHGP